MNIVFLADALSPIAVNWIRWFVGRPGYRVHWISSRPAAVPLAGLASFHILPLMPAAPGGAGGRKPPGAVFASAVLRHWLIPLWIDRHAETLAALVRTLQPDLLHAMRIPLEGMAAARALRRCGNSAPKLAVSVWGNDFTLHAGASPFMRSLTRQAVATADLLHADCRRDATLAGGWGLRAEAARLLAPGNGGIAEDVFFPAAPDTGVLRRLGVPERGIYIFNPRGIRGYARTDTFFRAIPGVLERLPGAHFLAAAMAGSAEAEAWVRRLGIGGHITLLPQLPPDDMAALFRAARVTVSVTEHDGTPNTLLEAMACGSVPVCGDLDSIREWIRDGENGLLIPPGDAGRMTEAVVVAAVDSALQKRAAAKNHSMIKERAVWQQVMPAVATAYQSLVE